VFLNRRDASRYRDFKAFLPGLGTFEKLKIYAEVVTFVAGSLEAGGLPGSLEIPEVLK
jgi:hypothetical protein